MPSISIVMTCFNQEKYITEAIESCIQQSFNDFEMIIVDDCSTDDSVKIIKNYQKQDNRIKLVQSDTNSGSPIIPRNMGVRKSNGNYILFLDADDKIAPTALEKMYHAITHNKGDIITCRVMQFGEENGEMFLPTPNKLNMANRNCLVNAALMRKSDFIMCGGFDERFSAMIEDYDLWLNLVYNHNKKIYRIPEILFYYRIKPKQLSRNQQKRKAHYDKLMTLLYQKYPLRRWHRIKNVLMYPQRVLNFFFRIQNYKVKVFKIPVYAIRKYDMTMSVGAACFVPEVLKKLKLRDFSGPFDWMYGSDVLTRLTFIKNRFKNYFDFDDFEYVGLNPDNGKAVYKNKRSGIVYNHDFPTGDFADVFPAVAEKYERRIKRVLSHLDSDERVLLVYSELGNTGDKESIVKLINEINTKYVADVDLLYINHNDSIELKHHTRARRISKHVIYAEYHYAIFPDELSQAKRITRKLVKRVAK